MDHVEVTERWSDRKFKLAESAHRSWVVTGVETEAEAIDAIGPEANPGTSFPLDPWKLFAGYPEASRLGPVAFLVQLDYDKQQDKQNADPPDLLTKFAWQPATQSEPDPLDAHDPPLPILNTNGDPFGSAPSKVHGFRILTATRYESTYNVDLAGSYENVSNSDTIVIPLGGGKSVSPGQMKCVSYAPIEEYTVASVYLRVRYTFEVKRGNKQDGDGKWDAFKHRILNQGFQGWWDDSGTKKKGRFVDKHGDPITVPLLLKADGTPFVSAGVFVDRQAPVASPNTFSDLLLETTSTGVFLKYYEVPYKPFAAFNLF